MTKASIFRLAAILILLLAGVELFACEVLAPGQCESFGFPQDGQRQGDDDKCICCCTHVMVSAVARLDLITEVVNTITPEESPKAERTAASIYHPPRT